VWKRLAGASKKYLRINEGYALGLGEPNKKPLEGQEFPYLRCLGRAAEFPLRGFARFGSFPRFLGLAMIDPHTHGLSWCRACHSDEDHTAHNAALLL
jgi:hypothetical protein